MKKAIIMLACCFWMISPIYAQNQADFSRKGRVLIETGYNLFPGFSGGSGATILMIEGESITSVGVETGYFISENFALKFRFGFLNSGGESLINFSGGGKYYISGKIPIEATAGLVTIGVTSEFVGNASIGYGLKLAPNINLEPSVGFLFSDVGLDTALFKFGLNFAMFL